MPSNTWVISSAIGMVTDLAASDWLTSWLAPSQWANSTPLTMPTTLPTSCEAAIGSHWLRMRGHC